jgi:hypothetical protein
MNHAMQSNPDVVTEGHTCDSCGKHIGNGWAFAFKAKNKLLGSGGAPQVAEVIKCFPCALRHPPVLKRSVTAAVVVGTVLTVLNQGDALFSGQWSNDLFWKIPLTYCVPLIVATYGALTNSRK